MAAPRVTQAEAAAELLRRRAVRRSLTEFAIEQGFTPAAHHKLLIAELEALVEPDSKADLLLVMMPPGSAKSTFINYLFPAWYLARFPKSDVLTASHSSELAERWGRKTRNLISSASNLLGTDLSAGSGAAYRWATAEGGEYYAVGVGVGIMGFRSGLGIIDDAFGSREDSESKRVRDRIWEWYVNDFSSRLRPGAKRVIMHQRFHEDDLAGRIIKQFESIGKPYRLLKIRAESTGPADDPLGRPAGEMLWDDPAGYDYGRFLRDRKAEMIGDPRGWSALFQQEPIPDTGDYFRREWLIPVDVVPPKDSLRIYGGSDYAVSSGKGDYTVHSVVGIDSDGNPWLVDLWRQQSSSDAWVSAFCDLVRKWSPMGWAEEQGQIRSGVGPFLEKEMNARQAYVVREQFPTRGDKGVRAQSFRALIATKGLRIPATAPWRTDVESELLRFPVGVHDDIVDSCLVEGTLVRMADGSEKPIEAVAVGDSVSTPIGPCEVTASAVTNEAAAVYRVVTAGGREIVATGSHPIHVEGKGFVRVDTLCMMDQITLEPSCYEELQAPRLSNISAIDTAGTQKVAASLTGVIFTARSRGADFFIGMFGKTISARFRKDGRSTIETETGAITPSRILNALRLASTGPSTLCTARVSSGRLSIWSGSEARPQSGTLPRKGSRGTARMESGLGLAAKRFVKHARRVVRSLTLSSPELCSAQEGASNAELAAARQSADDTSQTASRFHANAVTDRSYPSGQMTPHIAQKLAGCVIAIEALSAPARVRNLTVSRAHVFYANGLLTHNCGLVGQLVAKMIDAAPPMKERRVVRDHYRSETAQNEWDALTI